MILKDTVTHLWVIVSISTVLSTFVRTVGSTGQYRVRPGSSGSSSRSTPRRETTASSSACNKPRNTGILNCLLIIISVNLNNIKPQNTEGILPVATLM